jgi:hypothetical protein
MAGHDSIWNPSAPLEIAVRALPRIAEYEFGIGHVSAPPHVEALDGDGPERKK